MAHNKPGFTKALKAEAARLGFVACGITAANADFGEWLDEWLANDRHGTMEWMEGRKEQRASPQGLWPEAQSVIALAMSYAPETDPLALVAQPSRGAISVYAQGADYHDVIKKALKALARWIVAETGAGVKVFVDTAPVMEKPLGEKAGLGWQGKHSNLVSPTHGSWLFLGSIFTTLTLEPDAPQRDQCGSCTACQNACPTDAFPAPYQLDASRCISYLTIEYKGPIPHEFRKAMGNRIYGCDDCLAVCPWNKFASAAQGNLAFLPKEGLDGPSLATLLALDDPAFRAMFAKTPIKRIGRDRMVRNACIAAGNSGDLTLTPQLEALQGDPSEVVAEAAAWAIGALQGK
jgi:epoxyqueuosine reductase